MAGKVHKISYYASPTLEKFHLSDAFVRGVKGPIGSGKSVGMCFEIFRMACEQEANHDGIRKSRWAVVRNTLPQLETTTMKTWKDWFPPGSSKDGNFGPLSGKPPYIHQVTYWPGDGTKVELEVIFLALDKDEDVKKLLSLELTGIWFNEAREIPKSLVDAATGRVGRYPAVKDGGCTRKSVIMDTNPPDDNHWWYKLAEEDRPENWEFFDQPSGLSEEAENLENLLQPSNFAEMTLEERRAWGRKYYEDLIPGKDQEWINVYVHGDYGYIKKGVPVYAREWNNALHVAPEPLKINPIGRIIPGLDCSGRHPAVIFLQPTPFGQLQAVHELCITDAEGMGAEQFSQLMKREMNLMFPNNQIEHAWGDPAGGFKTQNNEETYYDILMKHKVKVRRSPGLRVSERVEATRYALSQLVNGKPMLLISPTCKTLIKAMNGGYHYKTISSTGESRDGEAPVKNRFSDIANALEYAITGLGKYREVRTGGIQTPRTHVASQNFKI